MNQGWIISAFEPKLVKVAKAISHFVHKLFRKARRECPVRFDNQCFNASGLGERLCDLFMCEPFSVAYKVISRRFFSDESLDNRARVFFGGDEGELGIGVQRCNELRDAIGILGFMLI